MSRDTSLSFRLLAKLPSFIISEPYETFFSVALFLTGLADIIAPKASGAVGHYLALWQVYSWGTALMLGSFITLVGLIGASRATNMHTLRVLRETERAGQLILGVATCLWSIVILHIGIVGIASGLLTVFLALVFIVRAAVIKGIEEYLINSKIRSPNKED